MLEDFLQDIYEKALTLEKVKEASFFSSIRHAFNRRDYWNEATESIEKIVYDLKGIDISKAVELMEGSIKVKDSYGDWHAFSAAIDSEVIPRISEYLKRFAGINVQEGGWTLESSNTGFLTIKNEKGMYLHSPFDPMWESFLVAYSLFDPTATSYYILGGGLGYLAYQLWKMSDGEADIYVFEIDEELYKYADLYGAISFIAEDKIHYVTGDDTDIILEKYTEDPPEGKVIRTIYYWDIMKYKGEYSDYFRNAYSNEVTDRVFGYKWKNNYVWNDKLEHKYFSELDTDSFKDEWVVVASGPSLNDNEEFIRDSLGKRTICCVNSSLKWFYLHNIKPDLCTVCDPTDLLVPHIEGFEDFSEDVPLVADCVANRKYMELYKGPRYYIHSVAAAIVLGAENIKEEIWGIGGTVTSLALGVAQKLGAKKVYLIGADLGYPEGETFAEGVGHESKKTIRREDTAVSVDDKLISTTVIFGEYRHNLEEQIAEFPDTEVINRSLHGAYIKGTFCYKWWENLPNSSDINDYLKCFENLKQNSLILGWKEKYYVFWQLLERIETNKSVIGESENAVISEAYMSIYSEFDKELNYSKNMVGKLHDNQTYVFIDHYIDKQDVYTQKALKVSKTEIKNRHNVLIVNTAERLSGSKVSIHDAISAEYKNDLSVADKVYFENMTLPFFQFPQGMPDIEYYRVFLDSIINNVPGKIVKVGKYNMLADFCNKNFDIPTETVV